MSVNSASYLSQLYWNTPGQGDFSRKRLNLFNEHIFALEKYV